MIETGKYTNSQGEEKTLTQPVFVEIFGDETSCQSAYNKFFDTTLEETQTGVKEINENDPDHEVALKFLPTLVHNANYDVDRVGVLLNDNPLVGKYFDKNSDEVKQIIADHLKDEIPF